MATGQPGGRRTGDEGGQLAGVRSRSTRLGAEYLTRSDRTDLCFAKTAPAAAWAWRSPLQARGEASDPEDAGSEKFSDSVSGGKRVRVTDNRRL